MSASAQPSTLEQALAELAAVRERADRYREQVHLLRAELEILRSAEFQASTTRMLAEEALDDTRGRLELALEAAQLALWEWNLSDDTVYLGGRWGDMMGDFATEGYGKGNDLIRRIHPDDLPTFQQTLEAVFGGHRQRYTVQMRMRHRHGHWIWLENHGMVADLDVQGHPMRLVGVSADISDRRALQERTEAARIEAENASRSKSEFLANVSHEVRTPLNGIMGLIRMLGDSPLTPVQQEWLGLMDSSAQTLLGLLNDILDLSKIEAGRMDLEAVPFSLPEAVQQVYAPFAAQAPAKGLVVGLTLEPSVDQQVIGDPTKLKQVLANLLSNAVKFTRTGGRIQVTVSPADSGQGIEFRVQDTGIGIPQAQQSRIFEAFTQADASTTRKYGGTGLGLAITSRLIDMMGGHMELSSIEGQGSTFSFTLPLLLAPSRRPESGMGILQTTTELSQIQDQRDQIAELTILVAEDHPINEMLMRELLKKFGCRTVVARNGLEAIATWKKGGIDLIMMDVQMPELNGLDAAREIRALEAGGFRPAPSRWQHTPIVAVTANALAGDREMCEAAGMDSYTSKPVSPAALTRSMLQALACAEAWPPLASQTANVHPVQEKPQQLQPGVSPTPAPAPALNIDKLRHRLDNDSVAMSRFAQSTQNSMTSLLQGLETARKTQDQTQAIHFAHTLKTTLATLTADRAAALCNGLETAARRGEWGLFGRALPVLRAELSKVDQTLQSLRH